MSKNKSEAKKPWFEMVQRASIEELTSLQNSQLTVETLMSQLNITPQEPLSREEKLSQLKQAVEANAKTFTVCEVGEAFSRSNLKQLGFRPLDREMRALPRQIWDEILHFSQVDTLEYVPEIADCDDFARIFVGEVLKNFRISAGLVLDLSGRHAYVAILVIENEELNVVTIEPQNDAWAVAEGDGNPMYKAEVGDVTI